MNRRLPVPAFTVRNTSGRTSWCNITAGNASSGGMHVAYRKGGASGFNGTLTVTDLKGTVAWRAGASVPEANLGGTLYQLDGCNGSLPLDCAGDQRTNNPLCTLGALSTEGWSVFDDTGNTVFADDGWWARSAHATCGGGSGGAACADLYVSVRGPTAFRAALQDLAAVSGVAPVPPRRFFGVWWSRWQKYAQRGLAQLAATYEANGIPLDGINLDTEWHRNDPDYLDGARDARLSRDPAHPPARASPQARWYSGVFDWDRSLYPAPARTAAWLDARGLWPVWLDIHQPVSTFCRTHTGL